MAIPPTSPRMMAHLLRRAAFGATPSEWQHCMSIGLAATTNQLLHPESIPSTLDQFESEVTNQFVNPDDIGSLKKWWVYRMVHSPRPLQEKLTLFWHNHFATANFKVDNPQWMWQQNQTLRAHSLGNFRTMLGAIARDPAMLVWLDGALNRKGRPNENFGREMLELFTMGIGGGYTETDVKEAARAFTGWRFDRDSSAFLFSADQHDDGIKTFLGQTGRLNGDDILDIVVRHPSTAAFITTKLYKFFVNDSPSSDDIASLSKIYFDSGFDIRAVVGHILTSPTFYSPAAYMAKVKSPAEFVAGTIRALDAPFTAAGTVSESVRVMGQDLYNPPNVKGWPEGRMWINSMTFLERVNFSNRFISELTRHGNFSDNLQAAIKSRPDRIVTPDAAVDAVWSVFMPGQSATPETRAALVAFAADNGQPNQVHFEGSAPGLTALILSSPEYQLA